MRLLCDRCGDSYDEDNLVECARCRDDVCWKCGIVANLPELAPGGWWCDRCLKAVGREDKLEGKRPSKETKTERRFSLAEKRLAREELKVLARNSKPGCISWPADEEGRKQITDWLEALGFSADSTYCFEVPPRKMPPGPGELAFSLHAYWILAERLVGPPLWKDDHERISRSIVWEHMTGLPMPEY
jgi:hypothetical protein